MSGFDSSYRPGASRGSSGTEAAGGDAVAEMRMRAAQHRRIIQRKAEAGAGAGDQTAAAPPTGGSAMPLPGPLRTKLEAQFQADFSEVQIHTGPEANASAKAVGARAYTTGHDLYFADGAYDPGSAAGQELIAHELTHVVQQKQGAVHAAVQHKSQVSQPGDPAELEADRVAAQVVAGRSVSVGAAPSAAVHLKRGGAAAVAEPEEEAEEEQQEEAAPEAPAPEAEAEAGAEPEAAPVEEPANADPRIAAVEAEAQVLAPEVAAELGPQMQNEPVARAYQALMAPEAEAAAEALPQPEAAPEPPAAAAPPKSRWQRFKSAVGGAASAVGAAASSAGKSIKKAFTFSKAEKAKLGNDVKDTAKLGVSVGKVAVPVAKLGGEALQGSATLASHAAAAAGSGGAAAGAAQVASTAGQVVSVAGHAALPAAALTAAVDARAAYSSGKKANQLNNIANQARDGGDQGMRAAANYGRDQKVKKTIRRTLTAAGGVLAFAGGIAILVSNPVGWILALAGGLIGAGVMAHKLYRKFFKEKKGVMRHEFSLKLQAGCAANNPHAIAAVKALGLDPKLVVDGAAGLSLIERKLKAT